MNILIYDVKQVHLEQLKHMVDAVKQVSKSDDWIVLPKGIDIIQDAPVDYLIHYRDMLNRCIEKQQEAENERP
jgi:hypothetical protein